MAIEGISLSETEEYISKHDSAKSEKEGATVWILGSLDVDLRATMKDNLMTSVIGAETIIRQNRNQQAVEAVRFGLKGFRNFKGKKGEVAFETADAFRNGKTYKVVSDNTLSQIPSSVLTELGNKILELNEVKADFLGNLSTE